VHVAARLSVKRCAQSWRFLDACETQQRPVDNFVKNFMGQPDFEYSGMVLKPEIRTWKIKISNEINGL
jgi:hypothetical protein